MYKRNLRLYNLLCVHNAHVITLSFSIAAYKANNGKDTGLEYYLRVKLLKNIVEPPLSGPQICWHLLLSGMLT